MSKGSEAMLVSSMGNTKYDLRESSMLDVSQFFDSVLNFIKTLGWTKGVFTIFFFLAHGWVYKLYNLRMDDRQKEIDRLAEDNKDYRVRFLKILDKNFDYTEKE